MDGSSVVSAGNGRLWEMVTFVDGLAVANPSHPQTTTAMHALAGLHLVLAAVPGEPPRLAESRGLAERIARARQLLEKPWRRGFTSAPRGTAWAHDVGAALARACDTFEAHDGDAVLQKMAALKTHPIPCQIVLRDVWSDHVLFDRHEQDHVVGIVDLHAMGMDTPATDVARLLGSWLPAAPPVDEAWWNSALDAYETVRPLGDRERRSVPLLAATGILFGIDNWFHWTLEEGRTFTDPARVLCRIQWLVTHLATAFDVLRLS
jgi:Ser/Thr protein kinase RdoA (MazF antagonist)